VRALRCDQPGRPGSLVLKNVAEPEPGPGEVLVDVAAAALNFPDALMVQGRYQAPVPTPFTPGSEFAGVVSLVGVGVTSLRPGDRVMGAVSTGAFAERVVAQAAALARVPDELDWFQAAAGTVAFRTAFHALVTIGGLNAGDHVVVLGASGGVGSASIDIAARLGGQVIAVVSSDERASWAGRLGANHTIIHTREDVKERIKELTNGGTDLVVDPVGGALSDPALRASRWGARYVVVGFASGTIPTVPLNLVLLKGVILRGFELRTLPQHLPSAYADGEAALNRLIAEGLRPRVSDVIGLNDVPDALERMLDHRVVGKIVVDLSR
jgi:NADPH2:quinone reductase